MNVGKMVDIYHSKLNGLSKGIGERYTQLELPLRDDLSNRLAKHDKGLAWYFDEVGDDERSCNVPGDFEPL
jgi:hypothetical protein